MLFVTYYRQSFSKGSSRIQTMLYKTRQADITQQPNMSMPVPMSTRSVAHCLLLTAILFCHSLHKVALSGTDFWNTTLTEGKHTEKTKKLLEFWWAYLVTISKALMEMLTSKSNRGGLKLPSAWMPLSVVCDSPNNHLPPIHWNEFNATTSTHRHTVVKLWLETVVKSLKH